MRNPRKPYGRTRWALVAGMRHYEFGWVLKARNWNEGYISHWFADRDEAATVKRLLESGLSFDESLREMHYRVDHGGP